MSNHTLARPARLVGRPLAAGAALLLALPAVSSASGSTLPGRSTAVSADATRTSAVPRAVQQGGTQGGTPDDGAQGGAQDDDLLASRPFAPGEELSYDVRFGALKVGTGRLEVRDFELVRGRRAYHTVFTVRGGTPFFRVHDVFESWFATDDLASLRFHKRQDEGRKERDSRYEIFPERRTYDWDSDDKPELPSVTRPLDDGSFIYFLRTVQLEPGKTYHFNQYFKPDRNPVTIKVLRRERVKVPAGTFDAVVVQPVIKTKGIFSEDGHAEVWLSDDSRRLMLQMKSKLKFGSINLYLTKQKAGSVTTLADR